MNFRSKSPWRVLYSTVLVALSTAVGVLGCGGGSKGTGGQTFDGRVLAVNTQPIPGVLITVNQSGDSAVSDSTGFFEIYTEALSGPVSLALSTDTFEGSVSLGDVPVGTARVTVTIRLDEESGEARAEGIEIEKDEPNEEEDTADPTPKPTRTPKPTPVPTSGNSPGVVPTPLPTPTPEVTVTPEPTETPDDQEGEHDEHEGEGEGDSPDEGEGAELEEEGVIQSLSASSLTVGGVLFEIDSQTVVVNKEEDPISFALLVSGDSVHVVGVSIDGHAVARTIKVTRTKRRESEE